MYGCLNVSLSRGYLERGFESAPEPYHASDYNRTLILFRKCDKKQSYNLKFEKFNLLY